MQNLNKKPSSGNVPPKAPTQESKPTTPAADWRKTMDQSKRTPAEKAKATRTLIKLAKLRDKNKQEFEKKGLESNGQKKPKTSP